MSDLIVTEPINAISIFTQEGGVDPILQNLKKAFEQFTPDLSTAAGRKEIASYAHKFSTSKTALVAAHKALVEEEKAKLKKIDAVKKTIVEACDDYRDRTRQPLTDWENAEKERVENITKKIALLREMRNTTSLLTSAEIGDRISKVENSGIDDSFAEFTDQAISEKEATLSLLRTQYNIMKKAEDDRAELEALKKEKEEREAREYEERLAKQKAEHEARIAKETAEREERIRREAEEKAIKDAEAKAAREKLEAEESARKERERLEREKQAAIDAQKAAEQREEQAKKDQAAAIALAEKNERERIAAEQARKEAEEKKLAEDVAHRTKVHNIAVLALVNKCGVSNIKAGEIFEAIDSGAIPGITIKY